VSDAKQELIRYRLQMAQETLEDARVLHQAGRSSWSVELIRKTKGDPVNWRFALRL